MNTVMMLPAKNVNLKPGAPAPRRAGASAGMPIRTFLAGLIHKPKGT